MADHYVATLDVNQAAGPAQAQEYAVTTFGTGGWVLTYDPTPTAGECQEPSQQTYHFCAQDTFFPHQWTMPDFTWAGTNFTLAHQGAHDHVASLHGPQYSGTGATNWLLGWFHTDGQCYSD